jgi:pimeloyl-ACP methyl ester carboxylesterase
MKTYFQFDDKNIHYLDEGKGKVIVLLHGFLESVNMWEVMLPYLAKKNRVICIDLPGHGCSELLGEEMSMERSADMVVALLDQLGVQRFVCVGHSMGGYVTMALAEKYPEYLKGIVLFHSHAKADSPEAKINRGRAIQVVKKNHKNFISHFIPDLFTEENREKYAEDIVLLQKDAQLMSKEAVIAALSGMRQRKDHTKVLQTAPFPIGFIIGQQDIRANIDELFLQIKQCDQAQVLMLKNVAHMGFLEDTEACKKFLFSFVNQQD